MLRVALLSVIGLVVLPQCAGKSEYVSRAKRYLRRIPMVRVALLTNADSAVLAVTSPYVIKSLDDRSELARGRSLGRGNMVPERRGIRIGGRLIPRPSIEITAKKDTAIVVEGQRFHGSLRVYRNLDNTLTVVNVVNLEDYLKGVVGAEMPSKWPTAALRAQVVASRTYALYQVKTHKDKRYDMTADVASQVYLGTEREVSSVVKAVNATRGYILAYDGQVFPTYFHSTCGGRTEDVVTMFQESSIPPLSGVRCNYCRQSKYYRWQSTISKADMEKKLRKENIRVRGIRNISINSSGGQEHGTVVTIDNSGKDVRVAAKTFRRIMGYRNIRSTAFVARSRGSAMEFKGRGWGHGVGMCQWGVKGLADRGRECADILKYYYPGAEIYQVYR